MDESKIPIFLTAFDGRVYSGDGIDPKSNLVATINLGAPIDHDRAEDLAEEMAKRWNFFEAKKAIEDMKGFQLSCIANDAVETIAKDTVGFASPGDGT